jgi:hypothetical protein
MTIRISTESKMCVRCGLFHLDYYLQSHCIACREYIIAQILQDAYDNEDGYDY